MSDQHSTAMDSNHVGSPSRSRISDFIILSQLGKGSYGTVYKVQRISDQLIYCIKSINLSLMNNNQQYTAYNEIKIMDTIIDESNIVSLYDSFIDCSIHHTDNHPTQQLHPPSYPNYNDHDRYLYIVMKYCNHTDLKQLLHYYKHHDMYLAESDVCHILIQLLLGIYKLHNKYHILHRDLKSGNIMLDHQSVNHDNTVADSIDTAVHHIDYSIPINQLTILIGDLGCSKLVMNSEVTMQNTLIGTPYSLSPELCTGIGYSSKSDIWAVGILLYELCTNGAHIFNASNHAALILQILNCDVLPRIDTTRYTNKLQQLIDSCLYKQSKLRPNVSQLLAAPLLYNYSMSHSIVLPDAVHILVEQRKLRNSMKRDNKQMKLQADKLQPTRRMPQKSIHQSMSHHIQIKSTTQPILSPTTNKHKHSTSYNTPHIRSRSICVSSRINKPQSASHMRHKPRVRGGSRVVAQQQHTNTRHTITKQKSRVGSADNNNKSNYVRQQQISPTTILYNGPYVKPVVNKQFQKLSVHGKVIVPVSAAIEDGIDSTDHTVDNADSQGLTEHSIDISHESPSSTIDHDHGSMQQSTNDVLNDSQVYHSDFDADDNIDHSNHDIQHVADGNADGVNSGESSNGSSSSSDESESESEPTSNDGDTNSSTVDSDIEPSESDDDESEPYSTDDDEQWNYTDDIVADDDQTDNELSNTIFNQSISVT